MALAVRLHGVVCLAGFSHLLSGISRNGERSRKHLTSSLQDIHRDICALTCWDGRGHARKGAPKGARSERGGKAPSYLHRCGGGASRGRALVFDGAGQVAVGVEAAKRAVGHRNRQQIRQSTWGSGGSWCQCSCWRGRGSWSGSGSGCSTPPRSNTKRQLDQTSERS